MFIRRGNDLIAVWDETSEDAERLWMYEIRPKIKSWEALASERLEGTEFEGEFQISSGKDQQVLDDIVKAGYGSVLRKYVQRKIDRLIELRDAASNSRD